MRWKTAVTIGVVAIVILIAAGYVYLKTYDYNKLKPLVSPLVEEATGRKLSLGGTVDVKFGFAPALVVTDMALANVSWGSQPQMVEIERLQVQVLLLPLLFKNMAIMPGSGLTNGCFSVKPDPHFSNILKINLIF